MSSTSSRAGAPSTAFAAALSKAIRPVTDSRSGRNLLTGVVVGHPLHPALAQLSLGCFVGAGVLDLRGRPSDAAATRALTVAGLTSAAPTVVAGLADWSHGHEQQQRVGLLHASANSVGLFLSAVSLLDRSRGTASRAAGLAGLGALGAAAYVGGHLAYRQALGANHGEHVPHRLPATWTQLCTVDDVPQQGLAQRMLGDQPLVVFRADGGVRVLSDVCTHLAGPLHEGKLRDDCLVCPWHRSRFRIADGSVHTGPATAPLPVLDVRVDGANVLVRLPGAG